MLHNNNFHILKYFTQFDDTLIYGRMLIDKIPMSPKSIANSLNKLEDLGILNSSTKGNIKFFLLNKKNKVTFDAIMAVEVQKKIEFIEKHHKIKHIFERDNRVVGIFGSYVRGNYDKHSDLDVFIVGKKKGTDYRKKGSLYDLDISIKYFEEVKFEELYKGNNPLVQEIVKNHVIINGFEKYLELIW